MGLNGVKRGETRVTRKMGVSKEGEGGGEEGGEGKEEKERRRRYHDGGTTYKKGKIGLLSRWTMEG